MVYFLHRELNTLVPPVREAAALASSDWLLRNTVHLSVVLRV